MKTDKKTALFFILPAFLGVLLFILVPVCLSFLLSFVKWDLIGPMQFVGFQNYQQLFADSLFYKILLNTLVFSAATTVFGVAIPLVLASIINLKIRGSEFFKTAYFLPFITPMVVVAIVWQWIFDPTLGLLRLDWLYNTKYAMFAIIIVSVWKLIGYNMVIFLTGFASISNSIYESAKIDGAGHIGTFFKITLPLLAPTIFFVVVITTISSFQVFDLVYLMSQGGPNNSTNVLVYWLFENAFEYFNIGKASAIAYVLFVIIFALTALQWRFRGKGG